MASRTRTQLRQVYDIEGGQIEIKITSEDTLTAEALKDFGSVVVAYDKFAHARPPTPAQVKNFPRAARAVDDEGRGA